MNIPTCAICGYSPDGEPASADCGSVRGNTERFKSQTFNLWKCPSCQSIHSTDPVDLADIYRDYPLNDKRRLDIFAKGTMANLLKRLRQGGLNKNDTILDFGCGNGIFLQFLSQKGHTNIAGFDPFIKKYAELPELAGGYDCVVANDVIEHVENPREVMRQCRELVRPGGLLYMGTADSSGVENMHDLEPHLMRLHQPFHRVIINQHALRDLGKELGLEEIHAYRRSYMDTLVPFSNYRFLDELGKALGHDMDRMLDPKEGAIVAKKPHLLFYAFFGYFLPSAMEPAVLWRVPN